MEVNTERRPKAHAISGTSESSRRAVYDMESEGVDVAHTSCKIRPENPGFSKWWRDTVALTVPPSGVDGVGFAAAWCTIT